MNDNFEEKRGRGRPKKDDSFNEVTIFRNREIEREMLEHLMYETDRSKSDIIRSAIRFYYNYMMNKR